MVGSGYMARKHCLVLRELPGIKFHTLAVSLPNHPKGQEFKKEFCFQNLTSNYTKALQNEEINMVFICTPNQIHAQQIIEALQYGKHVFCEKPLAYTLDEFRAIETALARSQGVLQVGMNCRFREQYSIPYEIVKKNLLGSLQYVKGTYIVNTIQSIKTRKKVWIFEHPIEVLPWLHSGAIHVIDLIHWIGGDVQRVFAMASTTESCRELIYDTFNIELKYSSGAIGEVISSGSAKRPNDFSLEIWGEKGSIVDQSVYLQNKEGFEKTKIKVVQEKIDLLLQFEDMIQAIEQGKQPCNSFSEAKRNLALIKAIEDSITKNQPVDVKYF